MWQEIKEWLLRQFYTPFRANAALIGMIFAAILSALWIYLGAADWTLVAYVWSYEIAYVLGTAIEAFNVKHRLVFFLALLFGLSSMLLFALLLASMLSTYPFAVIGWILFALPYEAFLPYNLLRVGRGQALRNP